MEDVDEDNVKLGLIDNGACLLCCGVNKGDDDALATPFALVFAFEFAIASLEYENDGLLEAPCRLLTLKDKLKFLQLLSNLRFNLYACFVRSE